MKIAVVGTGYVGLVTGTCLADVGHEVVCIDRDAAKVNSLLAGQIPIFEPGLEEIVHRNVLSGNLRFTSDLPSGVAESEIVFLAVGTPQGDDGSADLSGIWAVGLAVAKTLTEPKIIVIKSTVPVGTNAELTRLMSEVTDIPFDVANNPEFLKEGSAIPDFMSPDRVVVGARRDSVIEQLYELYKPIVGAERPFLAMSPESAELTKYVANCLLATKISFINEMANLCGEYGASIDAVCRGIGHDRRIGFSFLSPGPGYGGSCFPKDVRAAIHMAKSMGLPARMMEAVDEVNEAQKQILGRMILDHFGDTAEGRTVAIWGLAFKPQTDDIRESPALTLIDDLLEAGVSVHVVDPEAKDNVKAIYGDRITYFQKPYDALEHADAMALMTEWDEFRSPDFTLMGVMMRERVIFDGRNLFDPAKATRAGFLYQGVGRAAQQPEPVRDGARSPHHHAFTKPRPHTSRWSGSPASAMSPAGLRAEVQTADVSACS